MAIWSKVFSRINWQNKPSTTTPINATNLNSSDYALDTIDDRVLELNSRLNNVEPALADLSEAVEAAEDAADDAADSATAASNSATAASTSATDSEAWAIGERNGTPVSSSDTTYHNNSKYFAGLAEDIIQGGIPDGTVVSFYIQTGHLFVQQTIDGVQQQAVDLGEVTVPDYVYETTAAMNAAIAGGQVRNGGVCYVREHVVDANSTSY